MFRQSHAVPFILVTIFIDSIGFGLIMPVLPRLLMGVGSMDLAGAIELGSWMGLAMAVASFVAAPVIQLGCARAFVLGDLLRAFHRAAANQVSRDAGCTKRMTANIECHARREGAPFDHAEDIHTVHGFVALASAFAVAAAP